MYLRDITNIIFVILHLNVSCFIRFLHEYAMPVSVAVARINDILMGGKGGGPTGGGLVRTSGNPPPMTQHQLTMPPQHQPPPQSPAPTLMPVPTMQMPPVHQPPPMLAAPVQPPELQQVQGVTVVIMMIWIHTVTVEPSLQVAWQGHRFPAGGLCPQRLGCWGPRAKAVHRVRLDL